LALRAWRWQVILRPVAAIPYPSVARALLVGYGLNAIMPARLGELFRAEFFKKTYGLSRVWGLTSIVIALPASPPCADRRRHSRSRLGERAPFDFWRGGNLMLGEPANDTPRGNERDFVRRGGGKVLKSCPCR